MIICSYIVLLQAHRPTQAFRLVATPYAARKGLEAFKSDVKRRPETDGAVGYRRWIPDWNVWAVRYIALDDFIDHMVARDWIVVNIPELERETTAE